MPVCEAPLQGLRRLLATLPPASCVGHAMQPASPSACVCTVGDTRMARMGEGGGAIAVMSCNVSLLSGFYNPPPPPPPRPARPPPSSPAKRRGSRGPRRRLERSEQIASLRRKLSEDHHRRLRSGNFSRAGRKGSEREEVLITTRWHRLRRYGETAWLG